MKSYLQAVLAKAEADYAEIRLEETENTQLEYRGPHLTAVSQSQTYGGNIRVLVKGGWGFVSFNSLDELEKKLDLAVRQARFIARSNPKEVRLAPVPVVEDYVQAQLETDPRTIPLARKLQQLADYNQRILDGHEYITSSRAVYNETFRRVTFANSEGTYIVQEKLDLWGALAAMASKGGETQLGYHSFGSAKTYDVFPGLEPEIDYICDLAVRLLDAPLVEGGEYTVILDPTMAGLFVHEAFGHLSEADNVYEDPNMQATMRLGRQFGRPVLNIFDTGLTEGARGYLKYDDEGVATEKTYLIKEGRLVGRLHSRETAAALGGRPTGSARAIDYSHPPIVRMRNTSIEPGDATFEDMIKDIKLGIYARRAGGGQTNGEMFSFNCGEAYMIRDGKVAELVKNATFIGNVFTTLKNIDLVGADFLPKEGAGGCGKGGQAPLPVSHWCPHIRIQKAVIGGRSQ